MGEVRCREMVHVVPLPTRLLQTMRRTSALRLGCPVTWELSLRGMALIVLG